MRDESRGPLFKSSAHEQQRDQKKQIPDMNRKTRGKKTLKSPLPPTIPSEIIQKPPKKTKKFQKVLSLSRISRIHWLERWCCPFSSAWQSLCRFRFDGWCQLFYSLHLFWWLFMWMCVGCDKIKGMKKKRPAPHLVEIWWHSGRQMPPFLTTLFHLQLQRSMCPALFFLFFFL